MNYDSSYLYNLSGALVEETYPSGRKVRNTFEADGDLSKIETKTAAGAYQMRAQNLGYTSSGVLEKLQIGNGLWETAQLNSRLQVTQLGLGTSPTDTSIWRLNYDFGNNTNNDGNIKAQTTTSVAGVFNQTFQYDSLDRLKLAQETVGGSQTWIQNFSYDRYGNRAGFNQTINGQTTSGTPTVDVNTNRFTAGQGYTYDFSGNVVQDQQNRQFIFNGDNKQVEVRNASNQIIGQYFYDGDGKRIKKISAQETTIFVYSGGKLVAEYTATTATPQAPTTQYLATDMLGSPRVITDQNAQIVSRRDFMPFGEDIPNFGTRTLANGYKPDTIRQKFTGYQKDNETGLDFAEARYYNNSVGRFTAVDPLMASGKSANPQTFNRYVYVLNNPVLLSDPSGLCPKGGCQNFTGTIYTNKNGTVFSNVKLKGFTAFKGDVNVTEGKYSYRVTGSGVTRLGEQTTLSFLGGTSALQGTPLFPKPKDSGFSPNTPEDVASNPTQYGLQALSFLSDGIANAAYALSPDICGGSCSFPLIGGGGVGLSKDAGLFGTVDKTTPDSLSLKFGCEVGCSKFVPSPFAGMRRPDQADIRPSKRDDFLEGPDWNFSGSIFGYHHSLDEGEPDSISIGVPSKFGTGYSQTKKLYQFNNLREIYSEGSIFPKKR